MNFTIWSFLIALPALALGVALLAAPARAGRSVAAFADNRPAAVALTVVGWLWTAWELHTIGIEAFDKFLKAFPFELWILAAVLIPLTLAWMPRQLALKGLAAVLMLYPAEFFPCARLVPGAWRTVAVGWSYVMIALGMYAMFYTPRMQVAIEWTMARPARARAAGAVFAAAGVAVVAAAFLV